MISDFDRNLIDFLYLSHLSNEEIAATVGVSASTVARYIRDHHGQHHRKYKDLYRPVGEYFLTHTAEETCNFFKITKGQFKSIFCYIYKQKQFSDLRKDCRDKRPWSVEDIRIMLCLAGLVPRGKIAKIINRNNARVVKEKMQKLGIPLRIVNGMTYSSFVSFFNYTNEVKIFGIEGNKFNIVLWVTIEDMINNNILKVDRSFLRYIQIMASFQRWIHQSKNPELSITEMLNNID